MAVSPDIRNSSIDRLRTTKFDVLIIGGGITGAGALLEASSRGYKAALIDKSDFASGTSQASSKLIHGGLRYLANGEFALVYENLAERTRLLKNAPSIVKPLDFAIPLARTNKVFDKFGVAQYTLALWGYDLTGGFRIGRLHRRAPLRTLKAMLPKLNLSKFSSSFLYRDAWCDDVRLTLAVISKAQDYFGAVAVNYIKAVEPTREAGDKTISGFGVTSTYYGDLDVNKSFIIQADSIINATGVDAIDIASYASEPPQINIRPSKGVHIAFSQTSLPAKAAAVLPVPNDSRTIFVLPWGDYTYVGTTDTDLDNEIVATSEKDIQYLLSALNYSLLTPLNRQLITGAWVGTRPLIESNNPKMSQRTKDLSRRHLVLTSSDKMITIVGGKLTTYRKMAQDAVDAMDKVLGKTTNSISKTLSLEVPRTPEASLTNLSTRYGSRSQIVKNFVLGQDSFIAHETWPLDLGEVDYMVYQEGALRLSDVLLRRIRVGILDQGAAKAIAPEVLGRLAELLNLNEDDQERELIDFHSDLKRELPDES